MPGASIRIDQDRPGPSTSTGSAGVARKDLWQNRTVRPHSVNSASSYLWQLLDKPPGSATSLSSATAQTCEFTPDLPGSYRLSLTTDAGGPGNVQVLIAAVTLDFNGDAVNRNWLVPAVGEQPPENNFGGQTRGWDQAMRVIFDDLLPWAPGLNVLQVGVQKGQRRKLNLLGNLQATDNPGQEQVDIEWLGVDLLEAGSAVATRRKINIVGASTDDNPGQERIDIQIPIPVHELVFSEETTSGSSVYVRQGSRTIDMSRYPETLGPLARRVRFIAVLECNVHDPAFFAEVRLFDRTHSVAVAGTTLDNSGEVDRTVAKEFVSGELTVGTSAGNVRSDVAALYSVQFRANGVISPPAQQVILGGAFVRISYE